MNTQLHRYKPITERFMVKVNKDGPIPTHCPELGNCWEWTWFCYPTGHGQFWLNGRDIKAQRAAWIIFVGDPGKSFICHHCDNPKCVRLEHLYLGNAQTNMQDKAARKRTKWERCPVAKLTWKEVRAIRALLIGHVKQRGNPQYANVAKRFGIDVNTVSRIMRNWYWKLEDDPERTIQ